MGLLGRRWKAHVDNVKQKRWEYAADSGEAGIDLEDIGEHMNDALPSPVADPNPAPGWWSTLVDAFSGFGGFGGR